MREKFEIKALKANILPIVIFVIAIITVVNTIFLTVLMSRSSGKTGTTAKEVLSEQKRMNEYQSDVFEKCIKCSDFEIVKSDYSEHITGSVKNSSEIDLYNIQIEFACYDSFGDYIGADSVFIGYLPANTTYKVNDYATCDDISSVKILHAKAVYDKDINP